MDVPEQDEKIHGDSPPIRGVVDVSLSKVTGEESLLVRLINHWQFWLDNTIFYFLKVSEKIKFKFIQKVYNDYLFDKIFRKHEPFQLWNFSICSS